MTHDGLQRIPRHLASPTPGPRKVVALRDERALPCVACGARRSCPCGKLGDEGMRALAASFGAPTRVAKRDALFRAGQPFTTLYAVRVGTFKTVVLAEDGREQITDYHMGGAILGLDGLEQECHGCDAVALEDSEVCALPYATLDELAHRLPDVQHTLLRLVARGLVRGQEMILLLGRMTAEERLASYLLDLAERSRARGYSCSEFVLRMTRDEIASFLGLKLETVSRVFSRLHNEGLIQVQGRDVKLLDAVALKRLVGRHLTE